MKLPRSSGLILHVTSLPGPYGIGDLGESAFAFVDTLRRAGQGIWQVLPLGPTATGNSPYSSYSAFAGNPLLVSLTGLVRQGLLRESDLPSPPEFSDDRVDYDAVRQFKEPIFRQSFDRFRGHGSKAHREAFETFCEANRWWLDGYSLFMAIVKRLDERDWSRWDADLVQRRPEALQSWARKLSESIEIEKYVQFLFFSQWNALRDYARRRGVRILGDLPIFVALESADVWTHQDLFCVDDAGRPTVVAGVPPDYFSETGQLWGNPLYRWDRIAETGYEWWTKRIGHSMAMFDVVRLDHFRGFESYWAIPADAPTAVDGQWVKGPGAALFDTLRERLGPLPLVAEDLGHITRSVHRLRDRLDFPGMRVLQFAFEGRGGKYHRPERFPTNCVVFTGTHDNDTTRGWFVDRAGSGRKMKNLLRYLGTDGSEIHWDFIRLAWSSAADTAIAPLQDVLGLGSEARMNMPGRGEGNWSWRCGGEVLAPETEQRLRALTERCGRIADGA